MYYVYAIIDPINMKPFYIGKGKGDRLYSHLNGKDKINKKKLKKIEIIRSLGFEPYAEKIIEIENEHEAYQCESLYIKKCLEWNIELVNRIGVDLKPPSRKGIKWSAQSIEKRSRSLIASGKCKGKIISQEQRKKISQKNRGREGPNKAQIDPEMLFELYVAQNKTKKDICIFLGIGQGSLNRILHENGIKKTKDNFSAFSKSRTVKNK